MAMVGIPSVGADQGGCGTDQVGCAASLIQTGHRVEAESSSGALIEVGSEVASNGTNKCDQFVAKCHGDAMTVANLKTWLEAKAGFELCCLGGGHTKATCTSLATELFSHQGPFSPNDQLCENLMDLELLHEKTAADITSTSLLDRNLESRKATIMQRMSELQTELPSLFKQSINAMKSVGGIAALAVGAHTHSSKAVLATVFAAVATNVEKCDEAQWEEFCRDKCPGKEIDMTERVLKDPPTYGCCKSTPVPGPSPPPRRRSGGGGGGGGGGHYGYPVVAAK